MVFPIAASIETDAKKSKSTDSCTGDLKVQLFLNKPEIVLVEDSTKPETNAFILSVILC